MADTPIPWPIEKLEERPARDSDYEALWRLHIDAMQGYVAATYGWVTLVGPGR